MWGQQEQRQRVLLRELLASTIVRVRCPWKTCAAIYTKTHVQIHIYIRWKIIRIFVDKSSNCVLVKC